MKKSKLLVLGAIAGAATVLGITSTLNPNILAASAAWDYNAKTDVIIDNFYHDDQKRILRQDAVDSKFSMVDCDVTLSSEKGKAIYKYASQLPKQDGSIRFELKVDDQVDLAHIKFATRGAKKDQWSVDAITVNGSLNADGEANTLVPGEWVVVDINIATNFDAGIYEGGGDVLVTSDVGGFTLFNDLDTNKGHIQIRKVAFVDSANQETILDDFNRTEPKPENCWWAEAKGELITRNVTINNGEYTYAYRLPINKSHAVLSMKGDFSGTKVAVVTPDGQTGTYVKWADLKDHHGEPLPVSADTYVNNDIDLLGSKLNGEFGGISIKSTTQLTINRFFASDCFERELETFYPNLDEEHGSWLNDFNITYADGWKKEYSESPKALKAHGINYATNWANADDVTLDGQALVLPKLKEGVDYANIFFGMNDPIVKDYMVFKIKAEENADLSTLRFKVGSNEIIWLKDAVADFGLPTMPTTNKYPYVDENGYTYYIMSTKENANLVKEKINGELQVYYGHKEGMIKIDGIFFADKAAIETQAYTVGEEKRYENADGLGAAHNLGVAPVGTTKIEFSVTANVDGISTKNWRFQQGDIKKWAWIKDGKVVDPEDNRYEVQTLKKDETVKIVIDVVKTGFEVNTKPMNFTFFFLKAVGTEAKDMTVSPTTYYAPRTDKEVLAKDAQDFTLSTGYKLLAKWDVSANKAADTLAFDITSSVNKEKALDGIRFEFVSKDALGNTSKKMAWFASFQKDKAKGSDGEQLTSNLKEGVNHFELNLKQTGVNPYNLTEIKLHAGNSCYKDNEVNITLSNVELTRFGTGYGDMGIVPPADYVNPTVKITTDKDTYTEGDVVTLTINASDDVTSLDKLLIETKVTLGSGDSSTDIELVENKFTATEAGTYTITVTVTDEAGNIVSETKQIVVNEKEVEPEVPSTSEDTQTSDPSTPDVPVEPETPTDNAGLTPGAIAGIVIGSIAGLGVLGYVIYVLIKKFKK